MFENAEEYARFKSGYDPKIITIVKDRQEKNKLLITTNDENINEVISYLSDFKVKEFNNIKETLEDYFMKFYKEDKDFGGAL